jgi:hypothetical protein
VYRPALGPTQPPNQWVPGALSLGVKRPGLTTHLHLVPRSKNAWSYTSNPPIFVMAWCSVKSTGTTLPFYLYLYALAPRKFHMTRSNGSFVMAIKPKAKQMRFTLRKDAYFSNIYHQITGPYSASGAPISEVHNADIFVYRL